MSSTDAPIPVPSGAIPKAPLTKGKKSHRGHGRAMLVLKEQTWYELGPKLLTKVVNDATTIIAQSLERRHVAKCQIDDVDVVAHACSIWRIPIAAEHAQPLAPTNCNLGDKRKQVVWDALGVLANSPRLVRPNRVEVAKNNHVPCGVCSRKITEDLFDEKLCLPVRVGAAANLQHTR